MWSFGCTMGSLLLKKDPLFKGRDNNDQLIQIVKVLGTDDLIDYINKYKIDIIPDFGHYNKKQLKDFINEENKRNVSASGLDMLNNLLVYDGNV